MTTSMSPADNYKVLLAPLYHLELVKDKDIYYGDARTTEGAAQVLHQLFDRSPTEQLAVVYLDSAAKIVGAERVALGSLENVSASPGEIFRGAILNLSPSLLLGHNHPGDSAEPSIEDIMMTTSMVHHGAMLGVRIHDHIITTSTGKHISLISTQEKYRAKWEEAEERMMGLPPGFKKQLLDKLQEIGGGGSHGKHPFLDFLSGKKPGNIPPGGDPKANVDSDWTQSLSYAILNR